MFNHGHQPNALVADPWTRVYDPLINSLERLGYVRDRDLFVATYDWRLHVAPRDAERDGEVVLSGINMSDTRFEYGAEYVAYWIEQARQSWIDIHGDTNGFSVDIVAHSMGGLLTRAFVQSDIYRENTRYKNVIRSVYTAGTPNGGSVDAFLKVAPVVDLEDLATDINKGFSAKNGGGNWGQLAARLMWNAARAWGVTGLAFREWAPGVMDLLPAFNYGGQATTPSGGTIDITNHLLNDLNANVDSFTSRLDGRYSLAYGHGLSTEQRVEYVIGNALLAVPTYDGDGTVLRSSATLNEMINADLFPFLGVEHTSLLASQDVQTSVLDQLDVERPAGFIPSAPVGIGGQFLAKAKLLAGYVHSPLDWIGRKILGFFDPVDFIITDEKGRRLGSTGSSGFVNEFPDAYYSGEGPIEFFVIPLGDNDAGDLNLRLYGTAAGDYKSSVYYVSAQTYNRTTLQGRLTSGESQSLTLEAPIELPTISIASATVVEGTDGSSQLTFVVSLSAAVDMDVQVDFGTADGTAIAGVDYTTASGILTIPAGQLSAMINVQVFPDQDIEQNETMQIMISGAANAVVTGSQAMGTILNDDPGPDLSVVFATAFPSSVIGGAKGSATVRVTNNGELPATGAAGIKLFASADGVLDGGDVEIAVPAAKPLKLKPGASKTLKLKFVYPATVPDGSYYLLATVNSDQSVAETNFDNNVGASAALVMIARPFVDLTGVLATPVSPWTVGGTGTAAVVFRNLGNTSFKSQVLVRFYASSDAAHDGSDLQLVTKAVRLSLKPAQAKTARFKLPISPDLMAGSYRLIVEIDTSASGATDANLANNVFVTDELIAAT